MLSSGQVAFAVIGVVLLVGGGYTTLVGVEASGTCGKSVLTVAGEAEVDPDERGRIVAFENLTGPQQTLVERAFDGERPTVDEGTWPWTDGGVPPVEYRGEVYTLYVVTTECTFPPVLVLGVGVLGASLGALALALAGRTYLPSSGPSSDR